MANPTWSVGQWASHFGTSPCQPRYLHDIWRNGWRQVFVLRTEHVEYHIMDHNMDDGSYHR